MYSVRFLIFCRFTIARAGRAMIADEMGLGKSIQALAAARYYR